MLWSSVTLYLALAACAGLLAVMVVRYDLFDREPWYMLLGATLLGAVGMSCAGVAEQWVILAVTDRGGVIGNVELALLVGVTEELAKFLAVVLIFLGARRYFNEPLDGLIYGSFTGLGAAVEESVHMLLQLERPTGLPAQEPVRLAGHLVMGGIGSFGLGFVVVKHRRAWAYAGLALAAAMALHTLWDIAAFSAADHHREHGRLRSWHTLMPVGLMFVGLYVYRRLVGRGAALTMRMLTGATP